MAQPHVLCNSSRVAQPAAPRSRPDRDAAENIRVFRFEPCIFCRAAVRAREREAAGSQSGHLLTFVFALIRKLERLLQVDSGPRQCSQAAIRRARDAMGWDCRSDPIWPSGLPG